MRRELKGALTLVGVELRESSVFGEFDVTPRTGFGTWEARTYRLRALDAENYQNWLQSLRAAAATAGADD